LRRHSGHQSSQGTFFMGASDWEL